EGVVFDHHFPENLTTIPTRRSWWTGRYGFPDPGSGWTALRPDEPILPDLLWDQGVRTALISDVPLLRDPKYGFGRGFDEVVWVDVFGPHGPWDPPQPYRDQYAAEEPDEFEAGDEGDLVEEPGDDDVGLEEVPVLLDVPAGAVGDVIDELELLRLRRTYAGTV